MLQTCIPASHDSVPLDIAVPLFALDASDEHIPARIQAISSEAVHLRIRSHLSCGRRLLMHHEGCRTELEVMTCQKQGEGVYHLHCKVTALREGEVRDSWRMSVNWPA